MKKIMTQCLLVATLLLASVCANAQGLPKFGVKAGIVSSTTSIGSEHALDAKSDIGYLFGVTVDMNLTPSLFLATGLDLVIKNSKLKGQIGFENGSGGNSYGSIETKIQPMYLQVPVHLGYKIKLAVLDINLSAGPYAAYGIGGKSKTTAYLGKVSDSRKDDFFSDEGAKKFDYGIGARAGVDMLGLNASLGYDLGLANIGRKPTGEFGDRKMGKMRNRSAYFTVGYKF